MTTPTDKKIIDQSLNDSFYVYLKYGLLCVLAYFGVQLIRTIWIENDLLAELYVNHAIVNISASFVLFVVLMVTRSEGRLYHAFGCIIAVLISFTSLRTTYFMDDPGFATGALIVLIGAASTMLNRLWFCVTGMVVTGAYLVTLLHYVETPGYVLESNGVYAVVLLCMLLFFTRRSLYVDQAKTRQKLQSNEHALRKELETRKKIESDLNDTHQRLDAVMNQIPIGIFWKDKNLRYIGCNAVFARMQRFKSIDSIIGKTDEELCKDPATAEYFRASDREILETGEPQLNKLEHFRFLKNGIEYMPEDSSICADSIYYDKNKVALKNDIGEVVGILGTTEDVTAHRIMQTHEDQSKQQLLHSQKFESLGALSGGIAHEFNNILVGVLGNADFARHKLPEDSNIRKNIDGIIDSTQRATQLVHQMLLYSGHRETEMGHLNLKDVILEMQGVWSASVSKKIKFVYALPKSIPNCTADASHLRQALTNLVMNSAEAIGNQQGTITITAGSEDNSRLGNTMSGKGEVLYIEVSDTGSGMDSQTQSRIFDPFFTTKFAGRGLGMAAVHGIIHAHSGHVTVDSELEKGTTVRIEIPTRPIDGKKHDDIEKVKATADLQGQGTVLVIDDEEMVLEVTTLMLESMNFRVLTASNGADGLAKFEELMGQGLTAVILDRTMPMMSGEEVLSAIRELSAKTPVLVCSGYSDSDLGQAFQDDQYSTSMAKPFQTEDLKARLSQLVEHL